MALKILWEGRVSEIPEEFLLRPIPKTITSEFVAIYDNGSRTFHHGLKLTPEQVNEMSWVMSRCWDSLPLEKKLELNSQADEWIAQNRM